MKLAKLRIRSLFLALSALGCFLFCLQGGWWHIAESFRIPVAADSYPVTIGRNGSRLVSLVFAPNSSISRFLEVRAIPEGTLVGTVPLPKDRRRSAFEVLLDDYLEVLDLDHKTGTTYALADLEIAGLDHFDDPITEPSEITCVVGEHLSQLFYCLDHQTWRIDDLTDGPTLKALVTSDNAFRHSFDGKSVLTLDRDCHTLECWSLQDGSRKWIRSDSDATYLHIRGAPSSKVLYFASSQTSHHRAATTNGIFEGFIDLESGKDLGKHGNSLPFYTLLPTVNFVQSSLGPFDSDWDTNVSIQPSLAAIVTAKRNDRRLPETKLCWIQPNRDVAMHVMDMPFHNANSPYTGVCCIGDSKVLLTQVNNRNARARFWDYLPQDLVSQLRKYISLEGKTVFQIVDVETGLRSEFKVPSDSATDVVTKTQDNKWLLFQSNERTTTAQAIIGFALPLQVKWRLRFATSFAPLLLAGVWIFLRWLRPKLRRMPPPPIEQEPPLVRILELE